MKSRQIKRLLEWLFLSILIILLALGVNLFVPALSRNRPASQLIITGTANELQTAYPGAATSADVNFQYPISSMQMRYTPTPFPPDYPAGKRTRDVALEQTFEAYLLTSPPNNTITPGPSRTPPPVPTPQPRVFGMINSGPPMESPMSYKMTSGWQGLLNGKPTRVDAGARRDNPGVTQDASQGVVVVITYSVDDSKWVVNTYDSPIKNTGELTITTESNNRLTLQAKNGTVLYFDVPTRQFVDSLSAEINAPTVTPLPTSTPTSLITPPKITTALPYP